MYEVYESIKGRKHYLVFDKKAKYPDIVSQARKYFRCSERYLEVEIGWILNDELYLEDPHKKGTRKAGICSHWRRA